MEFAEAGRVVEKAPGVNFYPAGRKPDELNNVPHEIDEATCIGYIVFAVSKMHVDKPVRDDSVLNTFSCKHSSMFLSVAVDPICVLPP